MAPVGIAGAVAAALVIGVVALAGSHSPPPATVAAAVTTATPTASAAPSPTPLSAAAIQAGREYLAVVAPLNAAEDAFYLTLSADMSKPCSCAKGEFDPSTAMALIPGIDRDLIAFQTTLTKIKSEVPGIYADVDPVMSGNQLVLSDYAQAYTGWQQHDPTSMSRIADIDTQETAAHPDIVRLRADLGLPPPAAGPGPTSSLTSMVTSPG